MANLRLVGAVAIRVRPDTTGFRKDTQDDIDQALGKRGEKIESKAKVKVDVDANTKPLEAKVTKLSEELKNKQIRLNVGVDYDGVAKAKEQINQALKSLDNKVLSFEMNPESIASAKRELKKLEQNAKVEMKIIRDEAGFKSVLKKIQQIRNEKGMTKVVTFATDKESLKKAEKDALEGLKRLEAQRTVTIGYTKNYDGLLAAIGEIDKRLADVRKLKIETKLDDASLEATKAKLLEQAKSAPVTIKFNEDKEGYEKVLTRIKEIQKQRAEVEITFDTDEATLAAKTLEIKESLKKLTNLGSGNDALFRIGIEEASLLDAKHKAAELKKQIEETKANIALGLTGTLPVHAELAFLGRDRIVNYIARVSNTSVAAAEGALKGLGGVNILTGFGNNLASMITNFDTLALKASTLAVALGSLANTGIYAAGSLVRIGQGVGQSLGLLAAAPAVLGAATIGYTVFTAAFNNFFDSFNKDPAIAEASLAKLPPLARKTVDSITGLYRGLADPIQERFWEKVGTTLSTAIEKLYPNLKTGLMQSTDAVGEFVAGFGRAMTNLSLTGDFDKIFGNTAKFFENLSGASEPFFNGWNAFGVKGSELLPRFGTYITDAATRFESWAKTASESGQIIDWIEHGVNSFSNMVKVGGSVGDMFKAINSAADIAGYGGLSQFTINMREAADEMLGEPWQSRAANIFEGARLGAEKLSGGFQDLTGSLGASSAWLGTVLTQLGGIGGEGLSRLSDLLGRQTYQDGVTAELEGLQTLVDNLGPSFMSLGDIIGNMGQISGSVLGSFAPVLNQIMQAVDRTLTTLTDNLVKIAPKAVAAFSGMFGAIEPLLDGLTFALDGILSVVALVPNSFVTASVAAMAFFGLRAMASNFFDTLSQTPKFKELENNWIAQQVAAGNTVDKYKMVDGEMRKFTVPADKFNVMSAGWQTIATQAGTYGDKLRVLNEQMQVDGASRWAQNLNTAGTIARDGFGKALGGLVSALGGPWGIALAGAAIGIGIFAQSQADAKARVDGLTQAIDKQTGEMNEQGLAQIAKEWTDIGKAGDSVANLTRNAKAANETAAALGLSVAGVTKAIANGGPEYDKLIGQLDGISQAMDLRSDYGGWDAGTAKLKEFEQQLGLADGSLTKLNEKDINHLKDNIEKGRAEAALAKAVFEGLAEATGTTTIQAQHMATAMQTIGDNSTTAAAKIGAINKALDLLKGGKQSAREAEVAAQSTFQSAVQQAAALKEQLAGNNHLIDQTTKLIDTTNPAGLKLQQTMAGAADGIKIAAMAAYQAAKDAGAEPAEAMAASKKVLESHSGDLQAIADAAGVNVQDIQAEWDGFFGKEWELKAVFSASAVQVQQAKELVEGMGLEWNESVFEALLKAHPDPAKLSVDEVKAWAQNYANGAYEAQLKAMNPEALARILEATGLAQSYKDGNYTGVMKALNATTDGVSAAWQALMGVVGGPSGAGWAAAMKAYLDAVSKANTEAALNQLARTREMNIAVNYTSLNSPRPAMIDGNYNGSLTGSKFRPQPMQFFADGGFSGLDFVKPGGAKIYAPSTTWKVFAEETTGGEAFIPLAASKRDRSTQILAEVAQRFGYKLSKATAFEDGGITIGGNSRATGLNVHIDTFNQNAQDTIEDVGRGIMRQVRNAGMVGITDGI